MSFLLKLFVKPKNIKVTRPAKTPVEKRVLLHISAGLAFLCSAAYSNISTAEVSVTSGSLTPLWFDDTVTINKSEYCESPGLNACNVSGSGGAAALSNISIVVGGASLEVPAFTGTVNRTSGYTSAETLFTSAFTYDNTEYSEVDYVNQALITGRITSTGQSFSAAAGAHALFAIRAEVIDKSTGELVGGADIMGENCTTEVINDLDLIPSPCLNHFNNTIPVSFLVSLRNGHEYELQISTSCETRFAYIGAGAILFPGIYNRIAQCTAQVDPTIDLTDPPVITSALGFSISVGPDIESHLLESLARLSNLDTSVSSRASQESLNAVATNILARLEQQQTAILAQISQHDADIKGEFTQHDSDVMERLQILEGEMEALLIENAERTDEVIRLVKLPQGKRNKRKKNKCKKDDDDCD